VRVFTTAELSAMQSTQTGAMQDTCKIQVYSRTLDTYGDPVVTYTDGAAIVCGVEMTASREGWHAEMTTENIEAVIRLPIGTSLKTTDRILVTHRYAADTTDIAYEIVGSIRRGPSGLQVDVRKVLP
jgi:head-tail adaptor